MSNALRALACALSCGFLAPFGACSCDPDDDSTGTEPEDCGALSDLDGDGLVGCGDPDCSAEPHCQVPWASTLDSFLGAARFVPGPDDGSTLNYYLPSMAGPWRDLDGDGHLDTVLTVACSHSGDMTCIGDTPVHFAQYLVQAEDLQSEGIAVYEPADALYWQPLTDEDRLHTRFSCRGSTTLLDLDGDGFEDLVVTQPNSESGPAIRLWWGTVDGLGLPRFADLEVSGQHRCTYAVAAGDVIGDGFEDLLVWGGPLPENSIGLLPGGVRYSSLTGGEFASVIETSANGGDYVVAVERAGDLTGDGRDDVLLTAHCGAIFSNEHPCETPTQFLLAAFDGRASWPASLTLADLDAGRLIETEYMPWGVVELTDTGDLDGDGRVDVAFAFKEVSHATAYGGPVDVHGVAFLFPGEEGGWEGVDRGTPIMLLPSVATETGDFGQLLKVGDVDGDGLADVLVGAEGERVPAAIPESLGLSGEDGDHLSTMFYVFEGRPDMLQTPGARLFADWLVVDGFHHITDFDGRAPSASLNMASVYLDSDLDGDGVDDWVIQSLGFIYDIPGSSSDGRTVVEVLSGSKLLDSPQ